MEMDRTNSWLTLVANVGVIIGIIFLAVEIQQSNRIAIAEAEIEVRNGLAAGNLAKYLDSDFAELVVKLGGSDVVLTAAEEWRVYQYIVEGLNFWLAIEAAHSSGMIPERTYGIIEDDLRADLKQFPKTIPLYRQAYENYPSLSATEVFRTVDRVLKEYE